MAIIDLHCDTFCRLDECNDGSVLRRNNFQVDIEKLKKAGAAAQFFAIYVNAAKHTDPFAQAMKLIDLFYRETDANPDDIVRARSWQEARRINDAGKIAAFLTIEEGGVLAGKLTNLEKLYDLGVRLITLTWNYVNEIGVPHCYTGERTGGLTPFGLELVEAMNAKGILVDVSHLSDAGFDYVAKISKLSKKPFVASHSNARAITPHSRNLTDEMIKKLAECGGVMGVNFADIFLHTPPRSSVADIITHIKHIYQVGGLDVIALGSDFDGINLETEIEHMGQIHKLTDALSAAGFKGRATEKICWQNAARVMEEVLVN